MKPLVTVIGLAISSAGAAAEPPLPIPSGQYTFQHKFAEHPNMQSISLTAQITGHHIVLINHAESAVFPKGLIVDGALMWHSKSKHWIVGENSSDRNAQEVGGCSDGPEIVDLKNRVYWTC